MYAFILKELLGSLKAHLFCVTLQPENTGKLAAVFPHSREKRERKEGMLFWTQATFLYMFHRVCIFKLQEVSKALLNVILESSFHPF